MKQQILPTVKDIKNLKGKRVVLRLDFNVPIKNGRIVETMRIDRAIPTIEYLRKKKARIVIFSHIGKDATSSLKPVAQYLSGTMNIGFVPDFRTEEARAIADGLPEGGVVLFENLRLDDLETKNDPAFAKYLASFGEVYVNDAFAVLHRAHASVVGITKYLPSYAGLLIADEIKHLSLALKPKHPFLFILGGAKFETKMPLMKKFMKIADKVFVGGILANDFFHDQGIEVGKSFVDKYSFKLLPLLKKGKIILPTDVIVKNGDGNKTSVKKLSEILSGDSIVDVGPETIKNLSPILKKAKLIVWNGPIGFYEGGFDRATIALLKAITEVKATSIIGGGDTAVIVEKLGVAKKLSFVSTGGGATLDYLSDGKLPGIEAIVKCKKR
ncbi:MAG: phosphoglycerate kinase [Candidatus Yonathbacteria bacterium CG10_big_fil_rev_8_21_14_0_10_43_136]|uniref:Phosphoglycerate kinase n=1 Tax=Candidatus Nomurabacteria bacterium CG2_30_43_9 TaxID=1805283 RepID=A0A1J5G832_9BACT|nr:MAG: phosphoglycerate kinase [Candidatus Nomurabacteria bacterium CG2_30_43_9]PIQ36062.1 MAG: phosphoglycerate kinase [Candidatus Yonathbacteria bacterium CG17_big_fil_post_rev_8_21_14_2_50_43_9]PIR40410.1 MAG: phosphoglycerate kinase [Candidatus Yonathbacteria bacterium CG10_big_fil_rev_8_21_14_0_10_43_136]PIX57357.1 MAG: phosphoglycerate kinase [Candidatus Yonathbacteria bacterium CG_4_10_14_3_um_filter_43_12]PJC22018.1 MAG: phosphoglycerate kinase [Candidatus Yonathbacteria bacterium CG_4